VWYIGIKLWVICGLEIGLLNSRVLALVLVSRVQASALSSRVHALASASALRVLALASSSAFGFWPWLQHCSIVPLGWVGSRFLNFNWVRLVKPVDGLCWTVLGHIKWTHGQLWSIYLSLLAFFLNNSKTVRMFIIAITNKRVLVCIGTVIWFILRPCQHDNGYIDGRSQIKVHTDERTQVHSAQPSQAVTHPGTNRARRYLTSVIESPSKHWSPPRTSEIGLNLFKKKRGWKIRDRRV